MTITPAQCRAARGLTSMTQADLANASSVSLRTITHFENNQRSPIPANLKAIKAALEQAGAIFVDPNGFGEGVRLRAPDTNGT